MEAILKPKIIYSIILFLLMAVISTVKVFGQATAKTDNKTFGISALIQESQYDIMLPVFISKSVVLAPAIGISSVSEAGTDLALGVVTRFYLNDKIVRPFLGGRIGILYFNPSSGRTSTTDFVAGFLAGGEYFLNEGFSLGVEAQLNASVSDESSSRFGNPGGVNINTGAAVFATVYF